MGAIKGIVSKDFEDDLGPCEILSGVINYSVCRTPTQMQKSEANIAKSLSHKIENSQGPQEGGPRKIHQIVLRVIRGILV
jgi:hypothetical protein